MFRFLVTLAVLLVLVRLLLVQNWVAATPIAVAVATLHEVQMDLFPVLGMPHHPQPVTGIRFNSESFIQTTNQPNRAHH